METPAERFAELARRWRRHCADHRFAGNPAVFLEHEAARAIVALGEPAVPLIMAEYARDDLFWGALLAEITGIDRFGTGRSGKLAETKRRWLEWWSHSRPAPAPGPDPAR